MKRIELSKGKIAIIDDCDYQKISQFNWYASQEKNGLWYARAYVETKEHKQRKIRMHRLVLNMTREDRHQVDHRNHNGLDNRRCNLRIVSNAQNSMNRRKQDGCTSKYKGVCWDADRNKWRAVIHLNNKKFNLGRFIDEVSAARAYNEKAREMYGEYALFNVIN